MLARIQDKREALFLPAFCGTLVSDFYSVYAKMDCKKQNACLPSCGRPLSG